MLLYLENKAPSELAGNAQALNAVIVTHTMYLLFRTETPVALIAVSVPLVTIPVKQAVSSVLQVLMSTIILWLSFVYAETLRIIFLETSIYI